MVGRQEGASGQAKITRGALYLLIATAVLSCAFLFAEGTAKEAMTEWLLATPQSVWSELKLWQLVTSPLVEPNFVSLLFTGFLLWMFLPTLERWWGIKRFLLFALYTSVAGAVAGTLVGLAISSIELQVVAGLSPFIFAGILAYGILFAEQSVRFFGVIPMTGRQLVIGISVFMAFFVIIGRQWAEGAANVAAMATAWLIVSGKWAPRLWWLKSKQKRMRRKLRVVRDGDSPKKYMN